MSASSSEADEISIGSNSYSPSEHGSQSNASKSKDESKKEQLAQKETTTVFRLRGLVMTFLLMATYCVAAVIYAILCNSEYEQFESQYEGVAARVVDSFMGIPQKKIGAISSLKVALVAHGVDHARSWPFVTLSSFQQRSASVRSLSKALFVAMHPIVTDANRDEWEHYVTEEDSYWM
jgi:hypothetical protein